MPQFKVWLVTSLIIKGHFNHVIVKVPFAVCYALAIAKNAFLVDGIICDHDFTWHIKYTLS